MPYALAVRDGRLFAALGDGTVIETRDARRYLVGP